MKVLLLVGLITLVQAEIRIPLTSDENGVFYANISVPVANLSLVPASLSISAYTFVGTNRTGEPSSEDGMIEISSAVPLRYTDSRLAFHEGELSFLGVGPGSALTQLMGAVAIIRSEESSGELVLNISSESFASTCVEGSFISFENRRGHPWEFYISAGDTRLGRARIVLWETTLEPIPYLPGHAVQHITDSILSGGAVLIERPDSPTNEFGNCTSTILANLPDLTLRLKRNSIESGSIVIYPEDYMDFVQGECRLKFRQDFEVGWMMFDPSHLPQANVRMTSDFIWEICDARLN